MNSVSNSEVVATGEKVVIIGDASVGKTSIILRYVNNTFSDNIKPTIGCDHYEKEIDTGAGQQVKLSIWDTAGQERFRGLASSYYKKAKCIILVYDITKKASFEKLDFWRDEIMNFADEDILVVMVGNKTDAQDKREVLRDEAEAFAQKHGYFYLETSALENGDQHIQKVFEYVAENINKKRENVATGGDNSKERKDANEINLDNGEQNKEEGCKC